MIASSLDQMLALRKRALYPFIMWRIREPISESTGSKLAVGMFNRHPCVGIETTKLKLRWAQLDRHDSHDSFQIIEVTLRTLTLDDQCSAIKTVTSKSLKEGYFASYISEARRECLGKYVILKSFSQPHCINTHSGSELHPRNETTRHEIYGQWILLMLFLIIYLFQWPLLDRIVSGKVVFQRQLLQRNGGFEDQS